MSGTNFSLALGEYDGAVREQLARFEQERLVARLWAQDATLWSGDAAVQVKIHNRLGWLASPLTTQLRLGEIAAVSGEGFTDVVLLGMGGSSLAPEVFQRVFGNAAGAPRLHVLDNTHAAAVQGLRDRLDLGRTLFIVSSKSGGTIETSSFADYFWEQTGHVGAQFLAITDPGSRLIAEADKRGYGALFLNPQDIGGRYSVLSFFGLVPAALIGVDVARLLARAQEEMEGSGPSVPAEENAGLVLGTAMGALAAMGRDKLTLIASPTLESFGDWAEQLIAESTGKEQRGVLPVVGEPPTRPERYSDDRLFVYLRLPDEPHHDDRVEALRGAGHPVVQFDLQDPYDLGAHFFRWEFATAVAGVVLGTNPFDEPNVSESKANTQRLLEAYQASGHLPTPRADVEADGIRVSGVAGESPEAALRTFVDDDIAQDYIAILAYLPMTAENEAALQAFRVAVRDHSGVATTLGFGPRFLHSTGQFHKGGPAEGRFLQIVADDPAEVSIPGAPFDFATLARAQALGDLEALRKRDFPTVQLHLGNDPAGAIARLTEALERL